MAHEIQLGIVTTHPIQYQVPLFRELDTRSGLHSTVFYGRIPDRERQGKGFDVSFEWDLPLLEGYEWRVLRDAETPESIDFSVFAGCREAFRAVDVMLIHGWQSSYMRRAWWSGLWEDVPLLVRGESNHMKPRPWYVHGLHRAYLQPFDRYLYIGESNRAFYRNAGVSSEALHPAPYCVENRRFDEDWQDRKRARSELRSELGIEDEALCFLFCGKFIEKKRPLDVVKSFVQAWRTSEQPVHLLMVGDGERRGQTEALVPAEAPVSFTGFLNQTEIGKAYAAADAMVLPSNYGETWGLVVNEGMIFELPAIVSDRVGCGPDLIEEGETGYTVPFGDIDALASTMHRMARNPEHVKAMGKEARKLVMSEYTVAEAVDGIVEAAQNAYREDQ
jgi:glycosyltransferase involved in cell wall biosynthesis